MFGICWLRLPTSRVFWGWWRSFLPKRCRWAKEVPTCHRRALCQQSFSTILGMLGLYWAQLSIRIGAIFEAHPCVSSMLLTTRMVWVCAWEYFGLLHSGTTHYIPISLWSYIIGSGGKGSTLPEMQRKWWLYWEAKRFFVFIFWFVQFAWNTGCQDSQEWQLKQILQLCENNQWIEEHWGWWDSLSSIHQQWIYIYNPRNLSILPNFISPGGDSNGSWWHLSAPSKQHLWLWVLGRAAPHLVGGTCGGSGSCATSPLRAAGHGLRSGDNDVEAGGTSLAAVWGSSRGAVSGLGEHREESSGFGMRLSGIGISWGLMKFITGSPINGMGIWMGFSSLWSSNIWHDGLPEKSPLGIQ